MQPQSFVQQYLSKTDDELLKLSIDLDSLTEEARPALADEIRRRGIIDLPPSESALAQSQEVPHLETLQRVGRTVFTRLQSWFFNNHLDPDLYTEAHVSKRSQFRRFVSLMLNTIAVYIFALRISPMLVSMWFLWVVPMLQVPSSVSSQNLYLKHLELITIVPAMAAGYISFARFLPATFGRRARSRHFDSADTWAWFIPTLVLFYQMLQYREHSSIMSRSVVEYFFDIQKVIPTHTNLLASDPIRLWKQLSVTAPFYAGIAYSLGALAGRRSLLTKLFTFETREPPSNEI